MKRIRLALALLTSLFAIGAQAQTTTTYFGVIRDLANNPVTSGKVTFTLRPSTDVTESGLARFTTQTVTCPIALTGNVVGLANSNVTTTVGTTAPGTSVTVTSAAGFALNQPFVISGAGAAGATYVGTITNIVGLVFTVSPATSTSVSAGAAVYTACQVTMNPALQPQGSGYLVKFWPGNVNTATIFTYALNAVTDLSTVVSVQAQLPNSGGLLDLLSNQTISGNKTFTGISSFTNGGLFTDTQMNQYVLSNIGGINFQSEFQVLEGTHGVTDGFSGGVNCVPGATVLQCNGVAGYAVNNTSSSVGGAMGGYFQARAVVANSHNWGSNSVVADTVGCCGGGGVTLNGAEFTVATRNAQSTYATVFGGVAVFNPSFALNNTAIGFDVENQSNGTFPINSAFRSNHGVAVTAFTAGALCFVTGVVTCNSQPISLVYSNGGTPSNVSMQADSTGNINFFPTAGKALQVPIANPGSLGPSINNWKFVDGVSNTSTGQVADNCESYPANTGLRSCIVYSPPELITVNPFPPNFAPEWRIVPGSVHDTICDHTHIYCVLLAVPALVGSQGTIIGVGPVGSGGDMSSGSIIMNDPTLFPPPMGIPSSPGTMTCTAGATTYDFAILLVANLNTHAGGVPRAPGEGAYAKYHLTACAASGNTFAMTGGTLPSGTIANSLTPTEYEVGFSTTGANGPYFAQTAANLGCVAGNLGIATGVPYSCTIAGGSFSIAQANLTSTSFAFASDQKTGNPIDNSNNLLFFGTPAVSVSFNEQLRDIAIACQPTGQGANNPNVLIRNYNGQEGAVAGNGQIALYGNCGGYTGISGAMVYTTSQTPNSSYSHVQISGGPTSGTTPFYGIVMDAQINGTGGASGGPREVMDTTCALRAGSGNTPPETCFLVQGSRARVNFTDVHAEMNGAQDNWFITQGARASFAGIEGSNTAGIVVHCSSTAQACAGFNILAQGTAAASVDRCQASATAWQDDRVGGKTLKGCVDGFVGTDGFFRDLQLSPMTFAQLTGFLTCAAATEGYEASVTDDNTALAFNAIITGGGANHVHGYCNGTNWVMQ